jgi:SAM-dependent methyltransferase
MTEHDSFWDFYWETRLQPMENLGKRAAILAASRLIRALAEQTNQQVRVLELGCGEGQVVGTLVDSHARWCASQYVIGVDYNARSLERCRVDFPGYTFLLGDFTDASLLRQLGTYDILLFVNALHEVYSATHLPGSSEVDVPAAKKRVEGALRAALTCLAPGGWLVLFDGLEPPGCPTDQLQIRLLDQRAWQGFEVFCRQYQPFHITYREAGEPGCVELSRRDFTRYITKSIFLNKPLWQTERAESYQYYTEAEFRAVSERLGLEIVKLSTLTENSIKWSREVELLTPGETFPEEHILIQAQRRLEK